MICCVFCFSERDLGSFGERRGFDFLYTKNFARPRSDFTYTKNFARSGSDFIYTNRNAQNFLCAARGWGFFNDLMKIYEGRCDRKKRFSNKETASPGGTNILVMDEEGGDVDGMIASVSLLKEFASDRECICIYTKNVVRKAVLIQ